MKKRNFFFLFLLSTFSVFSQNQIEGEPDQHLIFNAEIVLETRASRTILETKLSNYTIYTIDLNDLSQRVNTAQKNTGTFDLLLNLPGEAPLNLNLYQNDMRAENYRAIEITENGPVELPKTPCQTYAGQDGQGQSVRMTIAPDQLRGFIKEDEELLRIEPLSTFMPDAATDQIVVYRGNDLIEELGSYCDSDGEAQKGQDEKENDLVNCFRILDIATDADFEYVNARGNAALANARILADLNLVEGLFENQINMSFEVVFQRAFATNTDPYILTSNGATVSSTDVVNEARNEWANNAAVSGIDRDLVHMFSGKNHHVLGSVGSGGIGVVCSDGFRSNGFTRIHGNGNGFATTAHEFGHNFNAVHETSCGTLTTMCTGINLPLNFSVGSRSAINSWSANNSGCLEPANAVTAFPYLESFESGIGRWMQGTNDNLNWSRTSGGTPSSGTGPNNAYHEDSYIYTEASGNSFRTADLISPCFHLDNITNPQLTFAYHMFGSNIGTLNVDVSTDCGNTWTNAWSLSGQQNTQENWKTASVNLSNFGGNQVVLRFRGVTGNGFRSDIAIDYIKISRNCSIQLSTSGVSFGSNGGQQSVSLTSTDLFTSVATQPWITVTQGLFSNNITISVTPNTSGQSRIGTVILSCGANSFSVTVIQAGVAATCEVTLNNFPYSESFESSNLGLWSQSPDDDIDWTRRSGNTPSGSTGPNGASCGSNYVYTEASGSNNNKTAILISPCFDLSFFDEATVKFDQSMFGSNMGTLRLEISTNSGQSYSTIWSRSGNQNNPNWTSEEIDVSSFVNQTVRFRFRGTTGGSFRSDMAIDCFRLEARVDPPAGNCVDSYEPNNSFGAATFAGSNNTILLPNACIDGATDNDYYLLLGNNFSFFYVRVRGNTSSSVGGYQLRIQKSFTSLTIETLPRDGSNTDTYLELYDGGRNLLAQDNNGGVNLFSRIVYNFNQPENQPTNGKILSNSDGAEVNLSNYPNPFNNNTIVSFTLIDDQKVSLTIYDQRGNIIAQPMLEENTIKGTHTYEFDGSELPNGVYLYTLQTSNGLLTKQMVIIH